MTEGGIASQSVASRRVASLDGLRAIAVGLVIAGHAAHAYLDYTSWWMAPFLNSSFGVRLFFVLSGYLITRILMQEWDRYGKIDLGKFYMRRVLRIFPAFYLFLLVIILLGSWGKLDVSPQQAIAAGTYTWNYLTLWHSNGPDEGAWFLGHLWTLSLEEQFYLVWPAALILLGKRHCRWLVIAIPLILPLVRVAIYFLIPSQRGQLGMMFHTAIDTILIGCAFALYEEKIWQVVRPHRWVLCTTLAFVFLLSPFVSDFFSPYRITIGFGLEALGAGVLILQARSEGWWKRFLSLPIMALVGTWSYSLYIWQQLFLTPYNTTWTGQFPLSLVCVFACAITSYYVIERPALRWKRRFERGSLKPELGNG